MRMMGEAEVGTSEREAGGSMFCVSGGTATEPYPLSLAVETQS